RGRAAGTAPPGGLRAKRPETAERDHGEELITVIGGVTQVVIEVEDQDRAKQFWTEKLGFELVQDALYGNERWLEVRTPTRPWPLVPDLRKVPRPAAPDPALPTSNVMFYAQDLQQTYQELTARGSSPPSRRSGSRSAGGHCSPIRTATTLRWYPASNGPQGTCRSRKPAHRAGARPSSAKRRPAWATGVARDSVRKRKQARRSSWRTTKTHQRCSRPSPIRRSSAWSGLSAPGT